MIDVSGSGLCGSAAGAGGIGAEAENRVDVGDEPDRVDLIDQAAAAD